MIKAIGLFANKGINILGINSVMKLNGNFILILNILVISYLIHGVKSADDNKDDKKDADKKDGDKKDDDKKVWYWWVPFVGKGDSKDSDKGSKGDDKSNDKDKDKGMSTGGMILLGVIIVLIIAIIIGVVMKSKNKDK